MRISDWSSDVCSSDLSADVSEVGRAEGCFAGIRCRLCGWRSPHDPRAAGPASALPLGKISPIRVPGGSSFTQDGLWINLWISRSCRPAANVLSSRLRRVFRFYRACLWNRNDVGSDSPSKLNYLKYERNIDRDVSVT